MVTDAENKLCFWLSHNGRTQQGLRVGGRPQVVVALIRGELTCPPGVRCLDRQSGAAATAAMALLLAAVTVMVVATVGRCLYLAMAAGLGAGQGASGEGVVAGRLCANSSAAHIDADYGGISKHELAEQK